MLKSEFFSSTSRAAGLSSSLAALDYLLFEARFLWDLRWARGVRYRLGDVLAVIVLGVLCGKDDACRGNIRRAYRTRGVRCGYQANEITAAPELLRALELRGALVSGDAMYTQTALAEQIVQARGDYFLKVKRN